MRGEQQVNWAGQGGAEEGQTYHEKCATYGWLRQTLHRTEEHAEGHALGPVTRFAGSNAPPSSGPPQKWGLSLAYDWRCSLPRWFPWLPVNQLFLFPATNNTMPPTNEMAPTMGGSGSVLVLSCVTWIGPRSTACSLALMLMPLYAKATIPSAMRIIPISVFVFIRLVLCRS